MMWLITPIGFFSIVQKPEDLYRDTLTIRARVSSDLKSLREQYLPGLGETQENNDTDYRFRATAPRQEISQAMAHMIEHIDYSNFKSEIANLQGHKRAHVYHDVWSALYQLQERK